MKNFGPKPAPYPETDTAEHEAILVFRSLINPNIIKDGITSRDKTPNLDGWIELLDEERRPIGKLDVQIKKLAHNKRTFYCPISLVGHSAINPSPIILICVDTKAKKAYWKHIHQGMPDFASKTFKDNRDTFPIRFAEETDEILANETYYQKWYALSKEYKDRIDDFPEINSLVENNIALNKISLEDRVWFQRFIGTINGLLSGEYQSLRQVLFPGVAEFGVGLFFSDDEMLYFQVYRIPYGKPSPHICQLENGSMLSNNTNPHAIAEYTPKRINLSSPEELGKKFFTPYLEEALRKKAFPILGDFLAEDIVIGFVDAYSHCLGLISNQTSYSIQEIDRALNQSLFEICTPVAYELAAQGFADEPVIDLDDIEGFLMFEPQREFASVAGEKRFYFGSRKIPMRIAFQALDNLKANGSKSITRKISHKRTFDLDSRSWVLGQSQTKLLAEISNALKQAIAIYSEFVTGNHLYLPKSPYLDPSTAIVFEFYPKKMTTRYNNPLDEIPILRTHFIHNTDHEIPKLSVEIKSPNEVPEFFREPQYAILGRKKWSSFLTSDGDGSIFLDSTPILDLVYQMLWRDFEIHFPDIRFSRFG